MAPMYGFHLCFNSRVLVRAGALGPIPLSEWTAAQLLQLLALKVACFLANENNQDLGTSLEPAPCRLGSDPTVRPSLPPTSALVAGTGGHGKWTLYVLVFLEDCPFLQ